MAAKPVDVSLTLEKWEGALREYIKAGRATTSTFDERRASLAMLPHKIKAMQEAMLGTTAKEQHIANPNPIAQVQRREWARGTHEVTFCLSSRAQQGL